MEIAMKKNKTRNSLNRVFIRLNAFLFVLFIISGCWEEKKEEKQTVYRADIVKIDALPKSASLERATVDFPHDLHTEVLKKQNKGCKVCHQTDDKKINNREFLSPQFV